MKYTATAVPSTASMPTNNQMAPFELSVEVLPAAGSGFPEFVAAAARSATLAPSGMALTWVTVTASKSALPTLS